MVLFFVFKNGNFYQLTETPSRMLCLNTLSAHSEQTTSPYCWPSKSIYSDILTWFVSFFFFCPCFIFFSTWYNLSRARMIKMNSSPNTKQRQTLNTPMGAAHTPQRIYHFSLVVWLENYNYGFVLSVEPMMPLPQTLANGDCLKSHGHVTSGNSLSSWTCLWFSFCYWMWKVSFLPRETKTQLLMCHLCPLCCSIDSVTT